MESATKQRLSPRQTARFKRLALPHMAALLRISKYVTHHDQQAEDLVQETMMKAMRAIDKFQEGTDIKAWLMTILRRVHIDAVRREARHIHAVSMEQVQIDPAAPACGEVGEFDHKWTEPAALLERFADKEVIEALKELSEDIRWTLLLVDVEQLDHAVAATILDVPLGTVKSRAHRGRAMLRDRLFLWAQERGWGSTKESSHARPSIVQRA